METILHDCGQLEITEAQADALKEAGLIYFCGPSVRGKEPCDEAGCGFWHIADDLCWDDVEAALVQPNAIA